MMVNLTALNYLPLNHFLVKNRVIVMQKIIHQNHHYQKKLPFQHLHTTVLSPQSCTPEFLESCVDIGNVLAPTKSLDENSKQLIVSQNNAENTLVPLNMFHHQKFFMHPIHMAVIVNLTLVGWKSIHGYCIAQNWMVCFVDFVLFFCQYIADMIKRRLLTSSLIVR